MFSCFLMCLVNFCWGLHINKTPKTHATTHNLYRLVSPIWLARDNGRLLDFFCACAFSGLMCVNSQFEEIIDSFQKLVISCSLLCLSIVLQIFWSCCEPPSFLLFPIAPNARSHQGSTFVRKEMVSQTALEKPKCWTHMLQFFPTPGRSLELGVFLLLRIF